MKKYYCNICDVEIPAFEVSAEGVDRCPICRSVARHRAVLKLLQDWSRENPIHRMLEIGGDGAFFKGQTDQFYTLDSSSSYVNIQGDIENICFRTNIFDVVLCLDVLEHVENDYAALLETVRILVPAGRLFLTASCWGKKGSTKKPADAKLPKFHLSMSGKWDCLCYRYYTEESILKLVADVGLDCHLHTINHSNMAINNVNIFVASKINPH